jgi:hypothetical protein
MAAHPDFEGGPPLKAVIGFCRGFSDTDLLSYAAPPVLKIAARSLTAHTVREAQPLLGLLATGRHVRTDPVPELSSLLSRLFELPEALSVVRPFAARSADLLTFTFPCQPLISQRNDGD